MISSDFIFVRRRHKFGYCMMSIAFPIDVSVKCVFVCSFRFSIT